MIKTITLEPGETISLPPDSTITAITGNMLSSCGDLPTPEGLGCYGILYGVSEGEKKPSETNESVTIKGFRINNTEYLFDAPIIHNAGSTSTTLVVQNAVNSNSFLKGLLFNVCAGRYANSSTRGGMYVISFKSISSLMSNAQIIIDQDGAPYPGSTSTRVLIPIRSRTQLETDGLPADFCICT